MAVVGCLDLETTGLDDEYQSDTEISQISLVVIEHGEEIAVFERKLHINPIYAQQTALDITGYDPKIWALEAVPPQQAIDELQTFCLDIARHWHISNKGWQSLYLPIFGHNIWLFDVPRLRKLMLECGYKYPPFWPHPLDTYQLAVWYFFINREHIKRVHPVNFKLETLATWFGFTHPNPHDALEDCRVNIKLAQILMRELVYSWKLRQEPANVR